MELVNLAHEAWDEKAAAAQVYAIVKSTEALTSKG